MHYTSETNILERLESIKAAILSSFGAIFAFIIISEFNNLVLVKLTIFNIEKISIVATLTSHWWVSAGIAVFSGLLFGVTYRYIIRTDNNLQLKAGGVMAFALVRGLVQVEMITTYNHIDYINDVLSLLPLAVPLVENIFLFAWMALVLDIAIRAGVVKAFKSPENSHE